MNFTIYLNTHQIAHIADVLGNLSIVFLSSLILPIFIGESVNGMVMLLGLVLAAGSFIISVQLLKGGRV
ncbi:hypothetical protein HZB69_04690 [Candidatus Amesbacteria bacterium]|nr:hypothetical protein [Candidatus Amesbacteria bacterium]